MTLRQSMAGLHTWGGLLPSWLLFVIIFAGTLACFDKELERWMRPALHTPSTTTMTADDVSRWVQTNVKETLHAYWMHGPTEREPYWRLGWEEDGSGTRGRVAFDPRSAEPMPETVGGEFFFTLHYNLQAGTVGMYIVGLAGMFMLVALVSGIIIHRRLFKDFFTLRPQANGQRAWLDAHNLFGVIGLPFHLVLAYTGVAVFVASYMPAGAMVAYESDPLAFFEDVQGGFHRNELHQAAGELAPVNDMLIDARQRWGGGEPGWIIVEHPSDASAVVSVHRFDPSRIGSPQDTLSYDAFTGNLLHQQEAPTGYRAYMWLVGLHMAQFGGHGVRLLYGLLGLAGCAMLVAGTCVWLRKREGRQTRGLEIVRALNGAVFFGLPAASLVLLWANRLLPDSMAARGSAEAWCFSLAWLVVAITAYLLRNQPFKLSRGLLALLATLGLGLVLLNGLTAPEGHLLASLLRGDLMLAGIDMVLVIAGGLCAWRALRQAPQQPAAFRVSRTVERKLAP
ncbi:PepSY domain-containing protein [Pseudomonas knackmussii]|uniref:PepSY domain-containing protein n=1 Tax=Pseudomonas knackmussii TaxID=65741 RepID=A0ABY4KU07_9PSED|nr:PepSY-associated TM helix domain-containing protein [Pseudomonas knackmussii]UPQ84351.1 PepSY domain-containing protein [Pseudomonas knackmussii]